MERFVPKNGVPKNGFPIVFSKSDLGGGKQFFRRNFFLKKPNTPEYAQVLVVTCPRLNSVTALLSPPPNIGLYSISLFLFTPLPKKQLEENIYKRVTAAGCIQINSPWRHCTVLCANVS